MEKILVSGSLVRELRRVLGRDSFDRYVSRKERHEFLESLIRQKDKWLAGIRAAIEGEVQRLTQQLARRVKELEERYARPLPELEREVETFGAKIEGHLKKMGLSL